MYHHVFLRDKIFQTMRAVWASGDKVVGMSTEEGFAMTSEVLMAMKSFCDKVPLCGCGVLIALTGFAASPVNVPHDTIYDSPRLKAFGGRDCMERPSFAWRGMMLDCSRHFFTVEEIKRNLDILAELKLNLFHWHLTDGRGWRIQIDRYPELTKAGATASSNLKRKNRWGRDVSDSGNGQYGPYFYTQAQVRDVITYAKARGIDVLPEIEIPGHSDGAIRAYPFLKCASGGRNELCLGRDEVLRFYEHVLDEVCELFPFGFLHIGGDECNVSAWAKCPDCQARKRAIGGTREQDLQHWVTRHFADYLAKKGKRIVGWDEIAGDPLLRKDAVIMNWRGGTYAVDAARAGHDVVVCCHSPCYLDYPQQLKDDPYEYVSFGGWLTAESAYQYDPYRNFPRELRRHVLGGQGNVWTEITADQKELEWKTYTRLAVLAEVLNQYTELPRDWQAFRPTLEKRIDALRAKGVNMAPTGPLREPEIAFPCGRKAKWGGGVCPILDSRLTRKSNGINLVVDRTLRPGDWSLSVGWRSAAISTPDEESIDKVLAEIEAVSFKYEPGVICIPSLKVDPTEARTSPEVRAALGPFVDRGEIAGVVSVLSDKDYVETWDLFGYADAERKVPMGPNTVFAVFSMSKTTLGAAMMCAIDDGVISLDDKVSKFLPEYANVRFMDGRMPKREITIRDLTCHMDGIRGECGVFNNTNELRQVARWYAEQPLQAEPGESFAYGTTRFAVAAACLEVATGRAYECYLKERIFDRLGMTDTTFDPTPEQVSRLVKPYTTKGGPYRPANDACCRQLKFPKDGRLRPSPGSGLFSTPADMIRFSQMLAHHGEYKGRRIISRATFDGVFAKLQVSEGFRQPYTCGAWLYGDWFGHEGAMRTDQRANLRTGDCRVFFIQTENRAGKAFFDAKIAWHRACDVYQRADVPFADELVKTHENDVDRTKSYQRTK